MLLRVLGQPAKSVSVKTTNSFTGSCHRKHWTSRGTASTYLARRRSATRSLLRGTAMRRQSSLAAKARSKRPWAK